MTEIRELDALVAEKVFGLKLEPTVLGEPNFYLENLPAYSSGIAAAWDIVEALRSRGHWLDLRAGSSGGYWASFGEEMNAEGDTAPLAICRAALKAIAP